MAKLKAPLLGFDAEGSIGKEVTYSKFKGRTYAKQYRAPANPKSAAQVQARNTLGVANAIWKAGVPKFRESWSLAVGRRPLSGYNLWVGTYMADNIGQPDFGKLRLSHKANGGLPPELVVTVPASTQIDVFFVVPGAPIGWVLQLMIGGVLAHQDPATATDPIVHIGIAGVPPGPAIVAGLVPDSPYVVTGWLQWLLPNGTLAFSQSDPMQGESTLP